MKRRILLIIMFLLLSSSALAFDFSFFSKTNPECNDGIDNDNNGYLDYTGGCDFNNNGILDDQTYSSIETGQTYYEREMTEEECIVDNSRTFEPKRETFLSNIRNTFKSKISGSAILGWTIKQNSREIYQIDLPRWYPPDPGCSSKNDLIENHCIDNIYNGGEQGLDCGWTCPNECVFTEKSEIITQDETWFGNINVSRYLIIEEGTTLTIEPGTIVKFKHDRDYKTFNKGGLFAYGDIIAIGTLEERIWFTSDASDPINGDWDAIRLEGSQNSEFEYVIVEYGEMGISQVDSQTNILNSIIRWTNSEGIYAERSQFNIQSNILYGSAYHEIALEQYNDVIISENIFGSDKYGHFGIITQNTISLIEGNCLKNSIGGVFVEQESSATINDNNFFNIEDDIYVWGLSEIINEDYETSNYFYDENYDCPFECVTDLKNFELSYIPGDLEDQYPYIYDEEDETRKVLNKIGENISFGNALEYIDGYLYKFIFDGGNSGVFADFIKINATTEDYERFGNDEIANPRGLTYDGEYFFVNDFSNLKIFKFKLENDWVTIYDEFPIPDAELGGTRGLTTDGEYIYLSARDGEKVYKLSKEGQLIDELDIPGGIIVWNGEHFWTTEGCRKGLCKYSMGGELVGEIYPPAKEVWAITWDGDYLWTIQRTCELWNDPKIYQIEILNDTLEDFEDESCVEEEDYILIGQNRECCESLIAYDCTVFCPGDYCCELGEFICLS